MAKLGLAAKTEKLVALCTDAFSEGLNLQRASCVVHLDTPTVIRLAEQRSGRVDRMNSPHDEVHIWWPKDAPAFAPRKRDLLKHRHEVVRDLIGANLSLPDEHDEVDTSEEQVKIEDLARQASVDVADSELDSRKLYDAFRPVRELIAGPSPLISKSVYDQMRTSQAEVVACVSVIDSQTPWCFMAVGGLERAAPRWVFFEGLDSSPELDLGSISDALRARLDQDTKSRERDDRARFLVQQFVESLRRHEHALLPVRRRRALRLLEEAIDRWSDAARSTRNHGWHGELRELREWLCFSPADRAVPFPDPASVADAWLRLIRPRVRASLERRRSRRKPWRLGDLLPDLVKDPIPIDHIWRAFDGVQLLPPADQRIIALILGVDGGKTSKG